MKAIAVALISLAVLACAPVRINSQERRLVKMTLVPNASSTGAYCLDGSSPAYHLDRGFGAGANHWLLQFEGGGWCNNLKSCSDTAATRRGSTRFMSKIKVFNGILSNNASFNPDFYNWNRVKLRYCDGASFAGDATFRNATSSSLLYFRGQRIWKAIILHLLPKGLAKAKKALLSGCSAGGLATFLHCDNFTNYLPMNASVKCLSDSGFFLDATDIAMNHSFRYFYKGVVDLQGVVNNLNKNCTDSFYDIPEQCFFPQYALPYIKTPFFILNSAYDAFQLNHILVPSSADPNGSWSRCKLNRSDCNAVQINTMQGFRKYMLDTLRPFYENSTRGGMYISSSFTHGQSENQDTWFAPNSTRVHNKTIAKAVGDWYFGRNVSKEIDCAYPFGRNVSKEIDCAYPCDSSCHNQ